MNNLVQILRGCLFSNTVQQAQSMLAQYSQNAAFIEQLLVLIPNQQPQLLIMIISTLKNYTMARWNPDQNKSTMIPQNQKQILRLNIFNLFYEIKHNEQAVNLYKQILYILVLANYPWPQIDEQLSSDLNEGVFASVHFCRQLTKAYQYSSDAQQRAKLQYFTSLYLPKLESLVTQSLTNYNPEISVLLFMILKTFYSVFHCQLPQYLKNQDNFTKWFVFIKTILPANLQNFVEIQRISAKILSRMVEKYFNQELDSKFMKGWAQAFRNTHANQVTQLVFYLLANPNGDQQTISYVLNCVMAYAKNQKLRSYLSEQNVAYIIYDRLIPNMQTNQTDLDLFFKDPLEYIRKDEDLNLKIFQRNAADTIEYLTNYCNFGEKSEMMKFIQYTASTLQSSCSDRHKQVLIRQLTKMSTILKKNKFIKSQFQYLTTTYFIPLLKADSPLLNSQVCRLFAAYLDDMKISSNTVSDLMFLIYDKMIGKSMVLKYNAILAFTSLLNHQSALNNAKGHFQNILQIYIKMLDQFQHENLLKCLQSIVNNFSSQIITIAPNLITHLLSKFYETYQCEQVQEDNNDGDGNNQAIAALSTIEQILQCPLSQQIYYNASEQIVPMIRQLFDELQEYFGDVLNLINVLVFKAASIIDAELVYVLCRKLLEGKNCQINYKSLDYDTVALLNKITEQSDSQYEANLISILKNLIQKLPDEVLHKYAYPLHSQLILCLIQNKRLSPQQLPQLNTSLVDPVWSLYLQSYKSAIYMQGQIPSCQSLKLITGISLYPWLTQSFDVGLVKIVLSKLHSEMEDDQDNYDQEDTIQMLEKYAQEDDQDEDQCEEYYGTEGVNYAFLYDSPYDSTKDKEYFVDKLKSLSNDQANSLMNMLNNTNKKRLQALFS